MAVILYKPAKDKIQTGLEKDERSNSFEANSRLVKNF